MKIKISILPPRGINKRLLYKVSACLLLIAIGILGFNIFLPEMASSHSSAKMHVQGQKKILHVLVLTKPSHSLQRYIIRRTWALHLPQDTFIHFVIGTQNLTTSLQITLKYEHNEYKDLLLLHNHTDTYHALTKKMLETFKMLYKSFTFDYILKVDEDSFVNLYAVKELVKSLPTESLYMGFFNNRGRIYKTGKHADTGYFLCDTYLPYALGGGYMLSRDLVHYIAINSDRLRHFANEDASVGTWLAPLDIIRKHDVRFRTESRNFAGCSNYYLVINPISVSDLLAYNKTLHEEQKLCYSVLKW